MVKAGTPISVSVSGNAKSFWTSVDFWHGTDVASLKSSVNAELLAVVDVSQFTVADGGNLDVGTWAYTANLTIKPRGDYGKAEDVISFVRSAFYNATGFLPTISSPTLGESAQPSPTPGLTLPDLSKFNPIKPVGELLEGLDKTVKFLIVGAVVLVAIVAFSPAAKGLGRVRIG